MLVPGLEGNSDVVAVAGVFGMVDDEGNGTVACAAGPSAAESGVAGSGEVRGEGPWIEGGKLEADEVGSEVGAEPGPEIGCTAGAVVWMVWIVGFDVGG